MNRIIILIVLCLVLSTPRVEGQEYSNPQPLQESIQAQLQALNLGELLDFGQHLEAEYKEYLPKLGLGDLLSPQVKSSSARDFLLLLMRTLLRELYLSLHLLRQLISIGILSALLHRLSTSFGSKTVVNLAFAVCFLVFILIGLESFRMVVSIATRSVDQMVSFMYSLLPVLSTLLVAVGAVTSSTIFHPLLWGLVGTIAGLVQYLLFPLILFGTAFNLAAHFSPDLPFAKLGGLFKQGAITLLGLFFLVFSGFMVVRGAIAPVADGITLRAAKYFTKTLIPIAGGMFADSLEIVVGGSLLIKNGVGIFGLVMVVLLVATPLIKVWGMVLIYKLIAALLEPICDERVVRIVGTLESALTLVFISLGTVAVMFLLSITILVGIGNLTVFMR